jgi:hypothetical protein
MKANRKFDAADLFCGAGGFTSPPVAEALCAGPWRRKGDDRSRKDDKAYHDGDRAVLRLRENDGG